MPAAAPIVLGAALSATSISFAAGALTIGFSLSAFAGSLVLGAISYALTPKPKSPTGGLNTSNIQNRGQTVAVRQPDLTRQFVYGHVRITRGYAHMQSTGANGTLHTILILCQGPLRAINEIWVNDYVIPSDWIDTDGNITQGRYAGKMRIKKVLGTSNQIADPTAVAAIPGWTADFRLQGIAYLYISMDKDQDVYPTGLPNFTAIVEGPELFDPRLGVNSWSTNIALYARDFITNSDYGFGANSGDTDDTNVAAQANICDEIVTTEDQPLNVVSVDATNDRLSLGADILPFLFGDRVEVSSSGTLPGGLSAATPYYVIPYQIKDDPRILLASSFSNAMAKVAVDITSAGSGDIVVTKTGEARYNGSGVVDTDASLSQTLNDIVTSMAGRAVCIGGYWTLLAGAWRSPTVTLGIDDMRGAIGLKTSMPMSDSYNVVKGLYMSPVNLYQQSDYPAAVYSTFIDDDNGIQSIKDINLSFTQSPTTAQRIAKIELFRGRQDIVFVNDFSTYGLRLQPGDTVELTLDRYGWEEKIFEVTEFTFDVNNGNILTRMTLRETAEEIYDWTSGEAIQYDPAPNTELPNPFDIVVVTGLGYDSRQITTVGADQLFVLVLDWDPHLDQFVVNYGQFEIQYKLSSETDWRPSFFVAGDLTTTDVLTSSFGDLYDVRIRALNNLGVRSNWNTLNNILIGTSGGIIAEYRDYEGVDDTVGSALYFDYGSVADPVGSGLTEDWGFV